LEAVVMAESPLVDRPPAQLGLRERYGLSLLAISRSGEVITKRLRSLELRPGEVMVVHGARNVMPDALGELPASCRARPRPCRQPGPATCRHFSSPPPWRWSRSSSCRSRSPSSGLAVVLLVSQVLTLRQAYDAIDWPILILLGALIPMSEAVRTTGGTVSAC
jgi:di/tricarboxylate transporter